MLQEAIMARHCKDSVSGGRADEDNTLPTDSLLVERVRDGDERAFKLLYRRYARFVASIAHNLIGDNSEVEDVVQETFVALHRDVHKLKDGGRVKSWLAIVASRMVRKRLGRRSRRQQLVRQVKMLGAQCSNPGDRERIEALDHALGHLPVRLRMPWAINRIEGASLGETAERCGVSMATVKRRIGSATERLERQLCEGLPTWRQLRRTAELCCA